MRSFKSFTIEGSSPAFTRQHFQMVANVIKVHPHPEERKKLADHHATIFAGNNPRFDKAKFYKAAGVNEAEEVAVTESRSLRFSGDEFKKNKKEALIARRVQKNRRESDCRRSNQEPQERSSMKEAEDRRWDSAKTLMPHGRRWDDKFADEKPVPDTQKPQGQFSKGELRGVTALSKLVFGKPKKLKEAEASDAARAREVADLKAARKKSKETTPYDPHTDQGDWKVHHRDEVDESTSPQKPRSLKEAIQFITAT
jgi:hypothetical protein